MHFERMAGDYLDSRPPYPEAVYQTLRAAGVIGPGIRVLEIGAGVWASIFGTGIDSLIPNTYEWTYEPETTNYSGAYPHGWCLDHGAGRCAQFFGGQTTASPHALMWQWSGGGGVTNGIGGFNGDLDTIDSTRLP